MVKARSKFENFPDRIGRGTRKSAAMSVLNEFVVDCDDGDFVPAPPVPRKISDKVSTSGPKVCNRNWYLFIY